ncbi:deoxyribodipyrimidine photo-lyase [Dyadobacter frigoris]|uniref:Cryptochrome DASH n=1 Tax=Dyadobacter frigoris TaxID=2576211 RepID=A0A4U6D0M0_9BACT|nr:deoxyribodipyrimidine photo-lyase [Dyadobacter frigoris]TKT89667.1 cryptochrome DASH [Dyadobacter frigoris]GLU54116.1 cryptochrome DASH [Dyadobacter frigoris]
MIHRIIYWFRNDLRLHDNEAFFSATQIAQEVVPVYVFDPRQFEKTKFGFRRAGALRAQFLLESVLDLRNRLREKGGDLLIRVGEPEKIVAQLAEEYNAQYIYTSKEIAPDETSVETSLSKNIKVMNVDIKLFWMTTLGSAVDLPFSIAKLPFDFPEFYEKMKPGLKVKTVFPEPEHINLPQGYEAGLIPSLPMLSIDPFEIDAEKKSSGSLQKGGETIGLTKLEQFIEENIKAGKALTSAEPIVDYELSTWLSLGCLSPRYIYSILLPYLSENEDAKVIVRDLLKRDFSNWTLLRHGSRLFKPGGIKHEINKRWLNELPLFEKWMNAETENDAVNTAVTKLITTGYLTTTERVLAADYLTNELGINWTWGAMFFESYLIDYNVSGNWVRWNTIAGVGSI